jgi:hypothetical protein
MDACARIKNRKFCPKERKPILATTERPIRVDYCRPDEFKGYTLNLWGAPDVNAYLRPIRDIR